MGDLRGGRTQLSSDGVLEADRGTGRLVVGSGDVRIGVSMRTKSGAPICRTRALLDPRRVARFVSLLSEGAHEPLRRQLRSALHRPDSSASLWPFLYWATSRYPPPQAILLSMAPCSCYGIIKSFPSGSHSTAHPPANIFSTIFFLVHEYAELLMAMQKMNFPGIAEGRVISGVENWNSVP